MFRKNPTTLSLGRFYIRNHRITQIFTSRQSWWFSNLNKISVTNKLILRLIGEWWSISCFTSSLPLTELCRQSYDTAISLRTRYLAHYIKVLDSWRYSFENCRSRFHVSWHSLVSYNNKNVYFHGKVRKCFWMFIRANMPKRITSL